MDCGVSGPEKPLHLVFSSTIMNSTSSQESEPRSPSFPDEEDVFQAEFADSAPRRSRSRSARRVLLLLVAVGVSVATMLYWLPSERANWQIAAAQAKWLEGDLPGAISILEIAAVEFPETVAIYEQRIQFYLEAKEYEKALADVQRIIELSSDSTKALGLKSQVLHHLGKHDEAIKVCEEMWRRAEKEWIGSAPTALNSLAYAQAIRDTQLNEALEHIDEALRLAGDNPAFLDTRGFVKYRLGDSKAAKVDIERAVEVWEKLVAYQEAQGLSGVRSYQSETERTSYQKALAVMLYHRSLVYDRLGLRDEAKVDRERVRVLGFEPNEQLF
jgi:tetratricopeptide (TPR) repeat protein